MKTTRIQIECDMCDKSILLKMKQPSPSNWFSIGGRHSIYGDVCSMECLEKLLKKRKEEIGTGWNTILEDYIAINKEPEDKRRWDDKAIDNDKVMEKIYKLT